MVVISGGADHAQVGRLEELWKGERVAFAKDLPLPHLAVVLENSIFIGHDSGISHLAAAAGAKCILLFGPTDPAVWAPLNANVHILRAPDGELRKLNVDLVHEALAFADW
jgi:heptosyltransferase-2